MAVGGVAFGQWGFRFVFPLKCSGRDRGSDAQKRRLLGFDGASWLDYPAVVWVCAALGLVYCKPLHSHVLLYVL